MKAIVILFLSLLSTTLCAGKIYVWTDENGVKQYSERPPEHLSDQNRVETRELKTPSKSSTAPHPKRSDKRLTANQKATMETIDYNYNLRVKQCKEMFKPGSKPRKNCIQEQEEIKQRSINRYIKN
jgi:hypothetical protein